VDADILFSNIMDLKEIEEPLAGHDAHQIGFIRQFWQGFHAGEPTGEKARFLEIWKLLPRLYHGLREQLGSRGLGYQGMQYRQVTEMIRQGTLVPSEGKTIVAGFNALNSCEKQIFSWLKQHGAQFFWDFDYSYLNDPQSEAGRFMRENTERFPPPAEIGSFDGLGQDKEIRIFELPGDVLQAKTVYRILEEKGELSSETCTETALVLCDEELLMPVITSLPGNVEELNVTMGYPLKNTPVFGFVDAILRLQQNSRRTKDRTEQFYHKDVTAVLLHPYVRIRGGTTADQTMEQIVHSNMIYVDRELLAGELEQMIFRRVESTGEMLEYFREVFRQILENLSGEELLIQQQLDREFIFQMLVQLNKLETFLLSGKEISVSLFERLFRKIIAGVSIPFEGEPLAGIQILGILETRLLDFEHVILLSMNEETMPATRHYYSYIPYSLRLAFGMPAREEMDAIYAYYFYRLLQRAGRIDLLYNSGSEGLRTGEMSRYLHQLIHTRGIEVIRPGMDISAVAVSPVIIPHVEETDRILDRYLEGGTGDKYLSPSAINTYMDCSLKFYLRYLAGIGEPDEVMEEIDAAGFGTVVHESVRYLYQEIADRNDGTLRRKDLEYLQQSSHPEEVLRREFLAHHFHGKKAATIEGRNIIALRVMLRYLEKIIQTDLRIAPFRLVSAEQNYQAVLDIERVSEVVHIRVGGKIDRVDFTAGSFRVIDYKTGDASMQFPTLNSLFDSSSGSRNGAAFQTLFYAWLVGRSHQGEKIMPGLYAMRALYNPDFDPAFMMGSYQTRTRLDSFSEVEGEYILLLRETLSRIFDPAEPFVQTENLLKCRVCDFAGICSRNLLE
jgi:hypothetical protein